jgi:hypothetical protein
MERKGTGKGDPAANTSQDSWAWNYDAHELGERYFEAHKADTDRLKPDDLAILASKLFVQGTDGSFPFKTLQETLIAVPGPNPVFSAADLVVINRKINDIMGTSGKTVSHAQAIMLWHAFIDQSDLKLLSPDPADAQGW